MMILINGKQEYVGLTVADNGSSYNSSMDYYIYHALVYNPETQKVESVCTGSDFSGYNPKVVPDLLPEYQAVLDAAKLAEAAAYKKKRQDEAPEKALEAATDFVERHALGRVVTVRRGKEAGKGGKVFWVSPYSGKYGRKLGVALTEDRTETGQYKYVLWTYTKKVDCNVLREMETDFGCQAVYNQTLKSLMGANV